MTALLEVLRQAEARRTAVGHFNVSNLVTLYGIVAAARQQRLPVVMGASEAERRFVVDRQLVAIVKGLPKWEVRRSSLTRTTRTRCLARWGRRKRDLTGVVCDFSSLSFDDNVRQTQRVSSTR